MEGTHSANTAGSRRRPPPLAGLPAGESLPALSVSSGTRPRQEEVAGEAGEAPQAASLRPPPLQQAPSCVEVQDLNLFYGENQALHGITMQIPRNRVTALIGPSGCGKSTLLRCFNRMNDLVDVCRIEGRILLDGEDIHAPEVNVSELRRRVGMVFQKPNPFPKTIFENVAYGLRIQGVRQRSVLEEAVERALHDAALWNEVKDRLHKNALELSGGQQQRLVIARCLAAGPEVLLLDEPASALDPISTLKVEELIFSLKENYTVIIVTHNMQQATRVSDYTAFLYLGKVVEYNLTEVIFTRPAKKETEDYVTGRYG